MKNRTLALTAILFLSISSSGWSMTTDERKAYLDNLLKILPPVPSFTAWLAKTGELPPDFDALPKRNQIPDPLQFVDGRMVTSPDGWTARRDEIMQLEQKYDLGTFPPKPKLDNVVAVGDDEKGNGYIVRNVKLVFGPQDKGSMRVRVTIPDGAGPFPVLIAPGIGGFGAGWAPPLIRRGYMCADFAGNDSNDDAAALAPLYPDYDFAALPRRAWAVQMVIDYLATVPQVDMNHIAMTGYSRDGKMAIIAAALDTRIAAVIAGSTGVGGIYAWRDGSERNFSESIESTTRSYPSWFVPRLRFFAGREDRLPIDGNLLVALVAPRACLIEYGNNDEVSQSWGMEHSYYSARRIYDLLGKPDAVGVMHLPGSHGADDHERDLDWLDIQFGRSSAKWVNELQYTWDYDQWKSKNGSAVDLTTFATHAPDASLIAGISTADQWQTNADAIRKSVQWMLGDEPPMMPAAARGGFGFGGRGGPGARGGAGPTTGPGARGAFAGRGGGVTLSYTPDIVNWVIQRPDGGAFGWLAPEKNAATSRSITFGYNVRGDLYYPADTPPGTKLPTVIWLHGFSSSLGYMWVYHIDLHPILALVKAGYAVLAYDQSGFGTRISEAGPFYDRNPQWSRMGRMVEDVRTAVDALQKDSLVDPDKIYLFGFSMGGTVALHEAALDPRVKGVVSICGFTPMRIGSTDIVSRFTQERALLPRLGLFAGQESKIPYDFDELIGTIAPRPVLICQPQLDRDAAPAEVHAAVDRAKQVYSLYNAADKLMLDEPWDYNRLPNGTQDRLIAWMGQNMK